VNEILQLILRAVEAIGGLARSANGRNAADAIQAILHIYNSLDEVRDGRITVEEVHAELARLEAHISANDAKADAAVVAKFGNDDPGPDQP
jgi:hypothetical protein